MQTLIIDDERLAREELRRLLSHFPNIQICGEAPNAETALRLCSSEKPDLLFLDIEMPGMDGFSFLEALPPPHPHVIFTTAYNAFAVRAFEVNALDYLLKPIHPKRLSLALERVEEEESASKQESNLPIEPVGILKPEDRVFVRDGDRCWFVTVRDIRLLESDGNHTRLHFSDVSPLVGRSMSTLEERLPASLFMRANRSQIVNLNHIDSINPWFSGSLKVKMKGGEEAEFSRRQAQLFRDRMSL